MIVEKVSTKYKVQITNSNTLLILAIQVDYDLYFSDATRSTAAQVVPFPTSESDSMTIALWVQFSQKDDSGIFFTLYEVE
jgi:hypothetical protein